jgi:hypothetical protein
MSTERHDADEGVRVDSGWALRVSGVLRLRERNLTRVKATDHACNV